MWDMTCDITSETVQLTTDGSLTSGTSRGEGGERRREERGGIPLRPAVGYRQT